jgi:hypothetical protein
LTKKANTTNKADTVTRARFARRFHRPGFGRAFTSCCTEKSDIQSAPQKRTKYNAEMQAIDDALKIVFALA